MSSFNLTRRAFVVGAALSLALAGCGLKPSLAPGGAAQSLFGRLRAREPKTRTDYLFVRRFEERIGLTTTGDLELDYTLDIERKAMGITSDQTTSRYMLAGKATYSVRRTGSDGALAHGTVTAFTGYSATGSTVATQAAQTDAMERLMTQLADLTVARLTAEATRLK
ncbi:hypothetical protein HJ526_00480 [Donghicola sp. C2-DW-16]|uniref:LPS-assembly lipoprotein n=1 Tax=Donghicola mangrovi TaxID=2729614 RepID=A0ABX2P9M3_9RHOB|nr:LPS assembly lipoprotein LptE [Donghicola mangrovi]NVO25880.1 hypothetical protein [Donghicola mangrovi]